MKKHDQYLSTRKKNESKKEDSKKEIFRSERSYSGFYRYFSLPQNAKSDQMQAKYENGLLEIVIPKSPELKMPQKKLIKINNLTF